MANSIASASVYGSQFDKAITQKAVTGIMADNAMNSKYNNAKTVYIPYVSEVGFGNYTEANGYPNGDVTVAFSSYTMSMDRGRELSIDRNVADQIGVDKAAAQIMADFVTTKAVPEIDAYNLSKLAAHAISKSTTLSNGDTTKPLAAFTDMCRGVYENTTYSEDLVCFVDGSTWTALQKDASISHTLGVDNFKRGDVSTKVKTINDIPIFPVKSSLMKDYFTFDSGSSSNAGGFSPRAASGSGVTPVVAAAKQVYMIVMPRKAAMFCKHLDKIKMFSPDVNQTKDSWKMQIRYCYDLFVKHSYDSAIQLWLAS